MYVMRTTKAGRTIEIEKYYTCRYNRKGGTRGKWKRPTTDTQKKANDREAARKLRLLMNENFGYGDLHVVLGYERRAGEPYRTKEEMKQDISRFLRRLRKEYRREGKELRYIHVAEIGEKGARHHHLVINYIDPRILQKCWGRLGRPMVYPLDASGQYRKLADYFIKYSNKTVGTEEALQGKRWNCSRNLRRPVPEYKVITDRDYFRSEARVPSRYQGRYYVDKDSVEKGEYAIEYGGYGFFRFTLIEYAQEDRRGRERSGGGKKRSGRQKRASVRKGGGLLSVQERRSR